MRVWLWNGGWREGRERRRRKDREAFLEAKDLSVKRRLKVQVLLASRRQGCRIWIQVRVFSVLEASSGQDGGKDGARSLSGLKWKLRKSFCSCLSPRLKAVQTAIHPFRTRSGVHRYGVASRLPESPALSPAASSQMALLPSGQPDACSTHPTGLKVLRALPYQCEERLQKEEEVSVSGTVRQTLLFEELPHKATE